MSQNFITVTQLEFPVVLIEQEFVRFCPDSKSLLKWKRKKAMDPILYFGMEIIDSRGNRYLIKKLYVNSSTKFLIWDFLMNSHVQVTMELVFDKQLSVEKFKSQCLQILSHHYSRYWLFKEGYFDLVQLVKACQTFSEIFYYIQSDTHVEPSKPKINAVAGEK